MLKNIVNNIKSKKGMTLVEVLTAITILMLMVFCFTPLFLSYLDGVNRAGVKVQESYHESGVLQKLIGARGTGDTSGYIAPVANIPLSLTAPTATVKRNSEQCVMNGSTLVVVDKNGNGPNGSPVNGDQYIDTINGDFLYSNPNDPKKGYTTIYTDGLNASMQCFPTSLTDDFKIAYLTIASQGFTFASNNFKDTSMYKLSYTDSNGDLQKLTYGKDYSIERLNNKANMLVLELYGGTDVSFEHSPLVFEYNGGSYKKEIEVDAPQMMMVGEKSPDGKYYYYVSRGELDENGNLIILRRQMNSVDPKLPSGDQNVTLDAAMNDVEWVPADTADKYARDGNSNPYGYYAMCGDDGQIRRFWKNPKTGNYYWGGDYTYYTDFYLDRYDGKQYMNADKTYSKGTSYKFLVRRNNANDGFNMANYTNFTRPDWNNNLQSANVWSATAFSDQEGISTFFYAADGKIYNYLTKTPDDKNLGAIALGPNYDQAQKLITDHRFGLVNTDPTQDDYLNRDGRGATGNYDYAWYRANSSNLDAFYQMTGRAPGKEITLTCVDSMYLTGQGGSYYTDVKQGSYELSEHGATTNVAYPTETYTLYCGYIPAAMDAWSQQTGFPSSYLYATVHEDPNSDGVEPKDITSKSKLNRAPGSETIEITAQYPKWRGNFGVIPYLTRPNLLTQKHTLEVQGTGSHAYYRYHGGKWWGGKWEYMNEYVDFYPYENLNYALTGKLYDAQTDITGLFNQDRNHYAGPELMENNIYNTIYDKQKHLTNGKVVDITLSYLSHPFATHLSTNPTDDFASDQSNDSWSPYVMYWNNRRETVTFLDCASTIVSTPNGDIPVSLMVGYTMGGIVEYSGSDCYVSTVMNNGIVYIRAGNADIKQHKNFNNIATGSASFTGEYMGKDSTGYKLDSESNVFHQFYYLNSRNGRNSTKPERAGGASHIGNVYGADYWQNNRHIDYMSLNGGEPDKNDEQHKQTENLNYLRCHPMSNTKVNCVEWGSTWNNNPEAMWGTENGTLLSWWIDIQFVQGIGKYKPLETHPRYQNVPYANRRTRASDFWNDQSVAAEFQSYKWIDNVDGKTFKVVSHFFRDTVGAHYGYDHGDNNSYSPIGFKGNKAHEAYAEFYDKGSRELDWLGKGGGSYYKDNLGFISVLESINDVEYSNDMWVAVGDQSGKNPADYCANGKMDIGSTKNCQAYTDGGTGDGSWVNVRYWVDFQDNKAHSDTNSHYLWKAVKISNNNNYNIVQINYLNGIWYATGYVDENNNDEWNEGERAVVCWATNPLISCNDDSDVGGWTENTIFYDDDGNGNFKAIPESEIGAINSVATRTL